MRAVGINIIVRPIEDEKSKGGILLVSEEGDTDIIKGSVISVGDGKQFGQDREMNVKEGEVVAFDAAKGLRILTEDRQKLRIITIDDVKFVDDERV